MSKTVEPAEIAHFAQDSRHWWDEDGPFRPLHRLNPVRMGYIRDRAIARFGGDGQSLRPLAGLTAVDIGCGGGLVCEPLARMGAAVTGVDADAQAIAVARAHADEAGLDIAYAAGDAAQVLAGRQFDIVCALEVVEHVADISQFVQDISALCKPDGIIIMSTLNRTKKSFLMGIVAAEYILRWVPRGTHHWDKFVRPSHLARELRATGATPRDITGLVYNPVRGDFALSHTDLDVNYLITAEKN